MLVATIVIVVIAIILIKPQLSAASLAYKDAKNTNAEAKATEENAAQLQKVASDYQQISNLADKINSYIPATPDIPDLVIQLEALASDTGNQFPKFTITQAAPQATPEPNASDQKSSNGDKTSSQKSASVAYAQTTGQTPTASNITKIDLQISLTGTFASLLAYLNQFQTISRLSGISSISISGATAESGGTSLSTDLKAYVYTSGSGQSGTATGTTGATPSATTTPGASPTPNQ